MVSTHAAVHIGGADYFAVHPAAGGQPIEAIEQNLLRPCKLAFDELVWWAHAIMAARTQPA